MAHPLKHAESSSRTFGGKSEDYLAIHNWFDESKSFFTDFRHRALRHHAEGIFFAERIFGVAIVNSEGKQVPVRYIGEQHVKEDLGRIPTAQDWLSQVQPEPWMYGQRFRREPHNSTIDTLPITAVTREQSPRCENRDISGLSTARPNGLSKPAALGARSSVND
jgi:hypothetical protein